MAAHDTINAISSRGDMLCDACKKAVSGPRESQPGSWSGPEPEFFRYAPRDNVWRGAHHIHDGDFSSAVRIGCYICYQLLEACPAEPRAHADSFRTFYELSRTRKDSYSLQLAIELRQGSPTMAAATQVMESYGTFKILPKASTFSLSAVMIFTHGTQQKSQKLVFASA